MIVEKYQKLNLKNKIIAALTSFVLIIFALIYFIIIPTAKDIKIMSKEIEEQRIDLEKKYIKGQSLKQLTENLKKIEPKLNLLDQIFINKNRELEFITTLENEANNSGVNQKIDLSLPGSTENQKFQKNSLKLSTQGNFNKQLKYLMNLESLSYYINTKSLELSSFSGGGQTAPIIRNNDQKSLDYEDDFTNISLSIDAETYWK